MIGDPFIPEEAYTFKGGKTDRCGRTSYRNTGHCSDAGGCVLATPPIWPIVPAPASDQRSDAPVTVFVNVNTTPAFAARLLAVFCAPAAIEPTNSPRRTSLGRCLQKPSLEAGLPPNAATEARIIIYRIDFVPSFQFSKVLVSLSHPRETFHTSFDASNKSQAMAVLQRWDFAG
jgi:hypothetical protein